MPHVVQLRTRRGSLDRFLNMDQRVGDSKKCVNGHADVLALQKLIGLGLKGGGFKFPGPAPSGVFDMATAYFIYHIQGQLQASNPTSKIDGDVSSAVNAVDYGGGHWCIIDFNSIAAFHDRAGWEALMQGLPVKATI